MEVLPQTSEHQGMPGRKGDKGGDCREFNAPIFHATFGGTPVWGKEGRLGGLSEERQYVPKGGVGKRGPDRLQ